MSRSFDERIILYFVKKISNAILFLFVMAVLFTGIGYTRGLTSAYFLIGLFLFFLWVWQLFRILFAEIKGSEVDSYAERFRDATSLVNNAYHALNVDAEDVEDTELFQLDGYCCAPIETEPLYRWDEADQRARSSNYQRSCFFLDKGILLSYTEVKSLVDSEYNDNSHIWRIAAITDVLIEKIPQRCRITPKRESEKIVKDFDALTIIDENGKKLSYAIGWDQMETAELLRDRLLAKQSQSKLMRKPAKKAQPKQIEVDYESLDKREQNALKVGLIGDDLGDL